MAAAMRPMTGGAARTAPPVAKRVPHVVRFGKVAGENRGVNPMETLELNDDLFWLRDDTRKDETILGLLREENSYTEAQTAELSEFRAALYDEMLSHIKEDDDTFPAPSPDGYEYWSRTVKGASFRQYLRRVRGTDQEELILDVNAVSKLPYFVSTDGWSAAQCDVHDVQTSMYETTHGPQAMCPRRNRSPLAPSASRLERRLVQCSGLPAERRADFGAHRPFRI